MYFLIINADLKAYLLPLPAQSEMYLNYVFIFYLGNNVADQCAAEKPCGSHPLVECRNVMVNSTVDGAVVARTYGTTCHCLEGYEYYVSSKQCIGEATHFLCLKDDVM